MLLRIFEALKNEPVRVYLYTVLTAGVALLVAFGVDLTREQVMALLGFIVAVLGLGEAVRSRVTPTRKVDRDA